MPNVTPEQLLVDYYTRTADQYDEWHLAGSEHNVALSIMSALIAEWRVQSVLDVAGSTGRGALYLQHRHPELRVRTNDLSESLLRKAITSGVSMDAVDIASTYDLPYADASFDLVMEFGALHHMARPDEAIAEMLRVSRLGIAFHDSNMYVTGVGSFTVLKDNLLGALLKMALIESGLLRTVKRCIYGRDYSITEGDGVFYTTYSVFQSVQQLRQQCDRIFVIPTLGTRHKDTLPLLGATHCLVVALKKDVH